jgi:aromatic-L-amino-acid decarboxylase
MRANSFAPRALAPRRAALARALTAPAAPPFDAASFKRIGHQMIDDLAAQLEALPAGRVWTPMPAEVRAELRAPAASVAAPAPLPAVYADYLRLVAPFASGNRHPGFMAWAQGGASPVGALAELLCGGLNMNCGGRDHAGIAVEQQVVGWVREWVGFPRAAGGLFMTGSSMANFAAVHAARCAALGAGAARRLGAAAAGQQPLRAYASAGAHSCVARALEMAGLGSASLERVPQDGAHRMDLGALRRAIARDRAAGARPFLLVGSAGTVDAGAFDDLEALADTAAAEGLWLHVDGAFGALAALSPAHAHRTAGLRRAQSLALDIHKFGGVPYDAGLLLARDEGALRAAFAAPAAYLAREAGGLAAGAWPVDLGPDLSRGARALKAWIVLRAGGSAAIGAAVEAAVALAGALAQRVAAAPALQLAAYCGFNIVCFRYVGGRSGSGGGDLDLDLDALNREVVVALQLEGRVAPSVTTLAGAGVCIRAALFNPASTLADVEALLEGVLRLGAQLEPRHRRAAAAAAAAAQ